MVKKADMERLQKVMAEAGIASRRQCEEMIRDGRVKVNGHVVVDLPVMVDRDHDVIMIGRRKLRFERKVYFLLNKPKKVICSNSDPAGRMRVVDLLVGVRERVYPVGRLDADSQGLLIMTNDGELANQLTHPSFGVEKTYIAEVDGKLNEADIKRLQKGIWLTQGKASMSKIKVVKHGPKRSLLEISLREGRNRQIRVMLTRIGHRVRQLTRVRIGRLTLRGLSPGKFRELTKAEVTALRKMSNKKKTIKKIARKRTTKPQKH